jgi:hypothetical protein
MQAINLDLNKSIDGTLCDIGVDIQFSLRPFIDHIIRKTETERTAKVVFYQYILKKVKAHPELWHPIDPAQLQKYLPIFELIYTALTPLLTNERNHLWAIGKPVCPCFYSGTNAFYDVLLDYKNNQLRPELKLPTTNQMKKSMLTHFYNLVLERFYNFNFTVGDYTVRSILDTETKLLKYYRLHVDSRFLDIKYNGELPELQLRSIKEQIWNEGNSLQILQVLLPLENFSIQGISIVNMIDVTGEYALEAVKNVIIRHNKCQPGAHNQAIALALKTLVGCEEVEFGLLPYLQLNDKLVLNNQTGFESIVTKITRRDAGNEEIYENLVNEYLQNPRRLIFPEISEHEQHDLPLVNLLSRQGVTSYALFPLYYNGKIVGALEVYTRDAELFKNYTLSKLETAFPLLSQLLQNLITDFNNEITAVITDKFTALQPAVQWRFLEAAYHYIFTGAREKNLPIETIFFRDVQPLYGAIDIKDSSILRNKALRNDLNENFLLLQDLLLHIKHFCSHKLEQEISDKLNVGDERGLDSLSDREIFKMEDYLVRQLPEELMTFAQTVPEIQGLINDYLATTQDRSKLYKHSLRYEESMQQINQLVTMHLEDFNAAVQAIFPCYFEKFRTDGVEYDLYMGQSIAPTRHMPKDLLYTLRFKQLEVMAVIARATATILTDLPISLTTTQLVFVYEKLIDISFRVDEQRFDVEGSYNIRYQMVKKRIDKAHRKGTQERLTQPGKITIIYFNSWEAEEYMGYIKKLQEQQLLHDDVEYIDIEELQGVEGLKALRVRVLT